MKPAPELQAVSAVALQISRRRALWLEEMRAALLRGDENHALLWARRLAGLEEEDEDDRAAARQH